MPNICSTLVYVSVRDKLSGQCALNKRIISSSSAEYSFDANNFHWLLLCTFTPLIMISDIAIVFGKWVIAFAMIPVTTFSLSIDVMHSIDRISSIRVHIAARCSNNDAVSKSSAAAAVVTVTGNVY